MQVGISFGKIILLSIKPSTEELGRLPGTDIFCSINQFPVATKIPGIIIQINSGTLCFANANFIRERSIFYFIFRFQIKDLIITIFILISSLISGFWSGCLMKMRSKKIKQEFVSWYSTWPVSCVLWYYHFTISLGNWLLIYRILSSWQRWIGIGIGIGIGITNK